MFQEVKKIKLEEANRQKEEQEIEYQARVRAIQEMKDEIQKLKGKQLIEVKHFSFLERWVTKRKEAKNYYQRLKEGPEISIKIGEISTKLYSAEINLTEYSSKLEEASEKVAKVERAKTLFELGVGVEDAINMLEEREITPVLTDEDMEVAEHDKEYKSKSDFIAVHKTRYMPSEGMIKTSKDSHARLKSVVTINGEKIPFTFENERNTIHTAVNDEVSSHAYGDWDDCTIVVLIPLKDIPNETIMGTSPVDTFMKGSVKLTESCWIICPESEVKQAKACNPGVKVIGYKGKNALGLAKPFLTQLGYRGECAGISDWGNRKSSKQFRAIMDQEGLKVATHSTSQAHEDEDILNRINMSIALCKVLKDKNLITSKESAESVLKQLKDQSRGFDTIIGGLCLKSDFENEIGQSAIVANKRQVGIFIDRLQKNGFNISLAYEDVLRKLGEATFEGCDEKNIDEIFSTNENATEEEKKNIAELKNVFKDTHDNAQRVDALGIFLGKMISDSILNQRDNERTNDEEGR